MSLAALQQLRQLLQAGSFEQLTDPALYRISGLVSLALGACSSGGGSGSDGGGGGGSGLSAAAVADVLFAKARGCCHCGLPVRLICLHVADLGSPARACRPGQWRRRRAAAWHQTTRPAWTQPWTACATWGGLPSASTSRSSSGWPATCSWCGAWGLECVRRGTRSMHVVPCMPAGVRNRQPTAACCHGTPRPAEGDSGPAGLPRGPFWPAGVHPRAPTPPLCSGGGPPAPSGGGRQQRPVQPAAGALARQPGQARQVGGRAAGRTRRSARWFQGRLRNKPSGRGEQPPRGA